MPAVPAPDGSAEPTLIEKKRILVKYNGVMQPFLWRRGASPDVLMSRLARALEPTADPRALVLIDSDNEECDLCDSLENNAMVDARFLEIRLATLPMSVSPAVIAEVVGVSKPITNRNRDHTKVC